MDNTHSEIENEIFGSSLANLKDMVKEYAESGDNIIFLGDRGTGKELFARLYFENTGRDEFKPVNCSGVPDSLLQSKLYGHIKGAFTGASTPRPGLIEKYGKNGVIFFDELGDASETFQANLLRLVQFGEYEKLGSDETLTIDPKDLRIIAATSKKDNVRDDLKDRFVPLYILELAARPKDIPELIKKFCITSNVDRITQNAFRLLINYEWPGNIRELKRGIEKEAILLCEKRGGNTITTNDLPSIEFYLEEQADNSDIKKIEDLPLNDEVYPRRYFLRYLTATGPKESEEQIFRERLLYNLNMIANGFNRGRRPNILPYKSIEGVNIPTFEDTTPAAYSDQFWEYQVTKNRTGSKIEKLYGIKKKTAEGQMKKARQRLAKQKD